MTQNNWHKKLDMFNNYQQKSQSYEIILSSRSVDLLAKLKKITGGPR